MLTVARVQVGQFKRLSEVANANIPPLYTFGDMEEMIVHMAYQVHREHQYLLPASMTWQAITDRPGHYVAHFMVKDVAIVAQHLGIGERSGEPIMPWSGNQSNSNKWDQSDTIIRFGARPSGG